MTSPKKSKAKLDPMERAIDDALEFGRFIPYAEAWGYVSGLEGMASRIDRLRSAEPARAAALYESLLAGLSDKGEDIDDSDGELGTLADDLVCRWVRARKAAKADPDETARRLLTWTEDDPYGIYSNCDHKAVEVLDRAGLQALERLARERFAVTRGKLGADLLRQIYSTQRDIEQYVGLCGKTGLIAGDCQAIAVLLRAKRKFKEALAWVERGIERDDGGGLEDLKRELLLKLGRGDDALQSAWEDFENSPRESTYAELMKYVPKAGRTEWHDRAMQAADTGDLGSLIKLWLAVKETERLAERLRNTSDREIERLSHYTTEPAAKYLAKSHPDVAAKIFRALGMRLINASKSRFYPEALASFQAARSCYLKADRRAEWESLVSEVRREHRRKHGFMPAFERIAQSAC